MTEWKNEKSTLSEETFRQIKNCFISCFHEIFEEKKLAYSVLRLVVSSKFREIVFSKSFSF